MKRLIKNLKSQTTSWYDRVCEEGDLCKNALGRTFEWVFFLLIAYVYYDMVVKISRWWTPNYSTIGDYLDVKLPHLLIGLGSLCAIVWGFDLLTPGSWIRKSGENAYASAAVLCALILGAALILSK